MAEQELAQRAGLGVVDDLHPAAPEAPSALLGGDRDERLAQRAAPAPAGLRAAEERLVDLDDPGQPVAAGRTIAVR